MSVNYEEIFNKAEEFFKLGDFDSALNVLEEIKEQNQKVLNFKYDLLSKMAEVCEKADDISALLVCLLEMEKITPENENLLLSIALNLEHIDKLQEALLYYQKILNINKRNYDAIIHIAILFIKSKKYNSALKYIEQAKRIKPNQYKTAYAYFKVYEGMCKFKEALRFAKEMVLLKPNDLNGYYNCARTYFHLFDYKKSLEYCDKYLNFNPDDTDILCLKVQCRQHLDLTWDIFSELENLINKYPDSYVLKKTYASEKLRNKNYEGGMKYYLNIISPEEVKKDRGKVAEKFCEYSKKQWHREDVTGKTLLVYQGAFGAGDYLMFSRYIHEVEKRAAKVIIEADENFYELFKYNFKNSIVIKETKEAIPSSDYDYSVSSMELFYAVNLGFDKLLYPEGWLQVPTSNIKEAAKTDIFAKDKINTGIFWRGKGGLMGYRSIDFENYIPLFSLSDFRFISFDIEEKDEKTIELMNKYEIKDCSKYIKNSFDTSAFMKNLDLFITVDSFPMHLAGSLGVKTFMILPVLAEWRWFYDTKNTPWYNFVRIFRQTENGGIEEVIQNIKKELTTEQK